jgi:hypothetical protein
MATQPLPTGFFAYPSKPPAIPEAITAAVRNINGTGLTRVRTWEQCRVGGKVIIQELCKEIANSDFFCADVTGMNANVMFELGYAIARGRRIWLVLDTSFVESKRTFEQIRILTTVGYSSYCNSQELGSKFLSEQIIYSLEDTIFESSIKPGLLPTATPTLLYLKARHDTEAGIRITNRVEYGTTPAIIDDFRESGVQTLAWYGKQVYSAAGVLCHLTNPEREGAQLHNARYALVAGMAYGMERPSLMLAEGDFLAPIDYRDLLHHYHTATHAMKHVEDWLRPLDESSLVAQQRQSEYAQTVRLATELKGLQLGEYIAENEPHRLVNEYFVETASYREGLEGTQSVFVGRKGSGKTANLLKLADELERRRGNLVCVIKPVAYELHGVLELMRRYRERDLKGYALESLWKFLLYTEMANVAARSIERRTGGGVSEEEQVLIDILNAAGPLLKEDFSVRLERCAETLVTAPTPADGTTSLEGSRIAISEILHSTVLSQLRVALGKALRGTDRVAILVDNLDKAWDRHAELPDLAELLLALLGAANRVQSDFRHADSRRESLNISLGIFLRSDIFYELMAIAREPDKIRYSKLTWEDPALLLRIIEERFVASHADRIRPEEMWKRYFCPMVVGTEIKRYLVDSILPRPRDLLFVVKAAVGIAVNRGHVRVEEKDLLDAEKQYSQYALDSILVEDEPTMPKLQAILYEFVGSGPFYMEEGIYAVLSRAGVAAEDRDEILDRLCALTFLGVEANLGDFRFATDPQEHRRNLVLGRKLAQTRGGQLRFMVNRPFWAFLEIRNS